MALNEVVFGGRMVDIPKFTPGEDEKNDRCWVVLAHNPPTKRDVPAVFMATVAWGNNARIMRDHGKKGKMWTVVGALKTRPGESADGKTKFTYTEIVVRRHEMGLDARKKGAEAGDEAQAPAEGKKADVSAVLKQLADLGIKPEDLAAAAAGAQSEGGDAPF